MTKMALFYGTKTGYIQTATVMIQKEFRRANVVTLFDISKNESTDFATYSYIIIGCPTWTISELQSDWEDFFDQLENMKFSGKKVAYFGTGEQVFYPDTFQDAMGILEEKVSELGDKTVGYGSIDGYEFTDSKAVRDGKFVGLALDEDNLN